MVYTLQLDKIKSEILVDKYSEYSIALTNKYQMFCAKINKDSLIIYNTNTVVIQGSNPTSLYNEICDLFGFEKEREVTKASQEISITNQNIVGTDEVGTGDLFGPIVVSACYVPFDQILNLKKIGVKDSKKLSDDKILELGDYLTKNLINSSVILNNKQFNDLISKDDMNMNKIKALLHNRAINNILEKGILPDKIVLDAFCSKNKYEEYLSSSTDYYRNVTLVEKADDIYIAVSCASIIARYYFLKAFAKMEKECGYSLPKGTSKKSKDVFKIIKKQQGTEALKAIAKLNFKLKKD